MRKFLQIVVMAMFFMLAAVPAWALGLGQLQVKSRLNEPLLAEIPVISSDPAELESLQARLASPETFLRVGLPLPDTLVSDLRFAIVRDAGNQPVIRVTSAGPVRLAAWTFLVEVEWSQGKLVREYSVLLTTPEAVANAPVPPVALPVPEASAAISRPLPAVSAPAPSPVAAKADEAPMAAAMEAARSIGEVRRGQTLSQIGVAIRRPGQDLGALMAALLEYNPDAFINGDIDRLRSGARLRLPASMMRDDAVAAFAADAAARAGTGAAATRPAVDLANGVAAASAVPRAGNARTRSMARLEIVPAATGAASKRVAGSAAGTGGKGDVQMNQQLQEARETVAARDAEVQELKTRVSSLEALQKQQSQLLQMKDTALAAAQQQLRERQVRPEPAAVPASPGMIAAWVVPLALALFALAFWAGRRGRRGTDAVRRQQDEDAPSFAQPDIPGREEPALFRESPVTPSSGLDRPSWLRSPAHDRTVGDDSTSAGSESGEPGDSWDPAFADAGSARAAGDERLALARTYLELDDRATARRLLQAVAVEGDPASASEARAMLGRLG